MPKIIKIDGVVKIEYLPQDKIILDKLCKTGIKTTYFITNKKINVTEDEITEVKTFKGYYIN